MDCEGNSNCEFDHLGAINELNMSSNDDRRINVIPRLRRFVKLDEGPHPVGKNLLGYNLSPYGWQPTNKVTDSQTNLLTSTDYPANGVEFHEDSGFVYVDPDQLSSKADDPVKVANTGVDAKKVCRKISALLKDTKSPSRGSRMFQKRRRRAAKFTLIGYGTQPPEDDRYSEPQEYTSSSEELSKIDYSTENEDIEVYDTPGLRNALSSGNNLNPSEQIVQKQFKNLAMDVGGMRGKGAKIFAKLQQRMENYVITDENRRHSKNRTESEDLDLETEKPKSSINGPYVRPGSSIAISSKTPQFNEPISKPRTLSGYCTDVEDDYKISRKPQINYFSDCESMECRDQERYRRSRPIHRRGWQPKQDDEYSPQNENNDVDNVFTDLPPTPPTMRSLTRESDEQFNQRSPIRKVMPPSRAPLHSPARSRESSLTRTTSLSPARTNVFHEESQKPKRNWSRVTFCPRKSTAAQKPNISVIDYPCAKSQSSLKKNVVGKNLVSRAPSQSPQRQNVQQKIAFAKPPMPGVTNNSTPEQNHHPDILPKVPAPLNGKNDVQQNINSSISQLPSRARKCSFNEKEEAPKYTSGAAVSLLEKPMKPKAPVNRQYPEYEKHEFADPNPLLNLVSENDFVQPLEDPGIYKQSHAVSTNQEEAKYVNASHNKESTNDIVAEQENVRVSSPASVLSYVSSNSSTYTSMLPSRCLTPPTRPYTPNASRAIKIVTSNGDVKKSEPKEKQNMKASPVQSNPQQIPRDEPMLNSYQPKAIKQESNASDAANLKPKESKISACMNASPVQPNPHQIPRDKPMLNSYQPKAIKQESNASNAPNLQPKESKISACLKVLDPNKTLFQPKPKVEYQPSPTLTALLQSESESTYGNMKTPSVSYEYPCKKVIDVKSPPVEPKAPVKPPISNFSYTPTQPLRKRMGSSGQPPQPLGIIAGEMKGKGAKMFEKQQKRMEKFSKETTSEDFPELQKTRSTNSPIVDRSFSSFSPVMDSLEEQKNLKNGMREVMGEFQKGSKPGKAKRPSDNKRKRDPLYYQQQLFYRPPSAADFVQPLNTVEMQSDASSVASSRTDTSSASLHINDSKSDTVSLAQTTSPTTSRSSLGGDNRYTNSSSSISSQKSVGPKTAPKPSKALITRQLSKPTSPIPVVSTSPTPDVKTFDPAPASPFAASVQDNVFSFKGPEETEKGAKYIEDLIKRMPDDHKMDGLGGNDEIRRRVASIDVPNTVENQSQLTNNTAFSKTSQSSIGDKKEVAKPKFNIKKTGVQVQMWKPGQ